MPTYDYRCDSNARVVEVQHRMSEAIATWAELCEAAGLEPGDTPADSPVRRLATGGNVVSGKALGSGPAPACTTGTCCPGGFCGLN
jgi:hypothetical protein